MDRAVILASHLRQVESAGQASPPAIQESHVLDEVHPNGLLSITLNRPRALNALSGDMIATLTSLFQKAKSTSIHAVVISSSSTHFCAGGDIRYLSELVKRQDTESFSNYLRREYQCDRLAYRCGVPYVALLDGVWMGGGVGITYGARYKVVTEKVTFAMPETGIGFLPDVSGSYFLPRLPGAIGTYIGLLGIRLKAADCLYLQIATHYVPSARMPELKAALKSASLEDPASVKRIIEQFSTAFPEEPSLKANEAAINRCFSASSMAEIIARLQKEGTQWANDTLRQLALRSPTSLRVTLAAFRKGAMLSLEDALNMEHQICVHFSLHPDFAEGVRAVIVDKDNKPKWQPATLAEVKDEDVAKFFVPIAPTITFA